jgi:hypothetical protein
MGEYLQGLNGMSEIVAEDYTSMNDLGMLFYVAPELTWEEGETQLFSIDLCLTLCEQSESANQGLVNPNNMYDFYLAAIF